MPTVQRFGGLNGLRFFAAYAVLMHHAEQFRAKYGLFHLKRYAVFNDGGLAVTFFFVLSGFLITYLLSRELEENRRIDVVRFYARRALRIWPLYFLIVFLGLFVVPAAAAAAHVAYRLPYRPAEALPYFVFFAPFIVNLRFGHHVLEPLWSIGVEEVFYFAWAPLVFVFGRRLLLLLVGVIVAKASVYAVVGGSATNGTSAAIAWMLQFEAMAAGGLGAVWVFRRTRPFSEHPLFSRPAEIVLFSLLAVVLFFRNSALLDVFPLSLLFGEPTVAHFLRVALFVWLILDVAMNERALVRLRSRVFDYLGDISYGIYMYQMLAVTALTAVFPRLFGSLGPVSSTVVYYALATVLTLGAAAVSKRLVEDPFLALKDRFAFDAAKLRPGSRRAQGSPGSS